MERKSSKWNVMRHFGKVLCQRQSENILIESYRVTQRNHILQNSTHQNQTKSIPFIKWPFTAPTFYELRSFPPLSRKSIWTHRNTKTIISQGFLCSFFFPREHPHISPYFLFPSYPIEASTSHAAQAKRSTYTFKSLKSISSVVVRLFPPEEKKRKKKTSTSIQCSSKTSSSTDLGRTVTRSSSPTSAPSTTWSLAETEAGSPTFSPLCSSCFQKNSQIFAPTNAMNCFTLELVGQASLSL